MDSALRQALLDMPKSALQWKSESIRNSVRRLAIDAARNLAGLDPDAVGRSADVGRGNIFRVRVGQEFANLPNG